MALTWKLEPSEPTCKPPVLCTCDTVGDTWVYTTTLAGCVEAGEAWCPGCRLELCLTCPTAQSSAVSGIFRGLWCTVLAWLQRAHAGSECKHVVLFGLNRTLDTERKVGRTSGGLATRPADFIVLFTNTS
jgi:hypothetical protein